MGSFAEFIIKVADLASAPLADIISKTRGANESLAKVQQTGNKLSGQFDKTGKSVAGLNTNIAKLASQSSISQRNVATLDRYLRLLERKRNLSLDTTDFNRKIYDVKKRIDSLKNVGLDDIPIARGKKGGILSLLGGVRGIAATVGVTAALAGAGSAIGMGMDAGAQRTSFETMAGQQSGGQLFGNLTQFAQDSIFGNELYQNAQTMLAFGGAVKDVMPDLKMLGDVSMGNKERLGSLSLAFSQIQSTGRLMGQDLLQLVNAGFNPLQVISDKTGISMGVLKDKMEDGQIGFDMVRKAFQDATGPGGKFFDMTNRIAETPFGKWEALKGSIAGVGVEFGKALMPIATTLMDTVQPFVDTIPGIIQKISPSIEKFAAEFAPALTSVGNILMNVIPPAMKLIANSGTILLKILTPVLKVVEFVASSFGRLIDGIADKIDLVTPKAESATDRMMNGVASTIADNKDGVLEAMSSVISGHEMDALFEAAGKRHGQLYAQDLQDQVSSITLTLPQQQVLASWATSGGKFVSNLGSADPYGDYLETMPTAQEVLDKLPALLRATGLNKGRNEFEKLASEYLNAHAFAGMSEKDAEIIRKGAGKIIDEQRNYIIKLANGNGASIGNGYKFTPGKADRGGGKGRDVSDRISSGGARPTTINLTIHKLQDQIVVHTTELKVGAKDAAQQVMQEILQMLNSVNVKAAGIGG